MNIPSNDNGSQAKKAASTEVSAEVQNLFTIAQIAEKLGKSDDTIRNRIKAVGLEPEVHAKDTQQGRTPAYYSYAAFAKLEEEEEEARLAKKHKDLVQRHVKALTEEERKVTIQETYDSLSLKDKAKFSMENMLATMQAIMENAQATEDALDAITKKHDQLTIQLNVNKNWVTTLQWCESRNC